MMIKIKYEGKNQNCEVMEEECKNRDCLVVHRYTHNNKTIDGSSACRRDEFLSCATRNYRGCPDKFAY